MTDTLEIIQTSALDEKTKEQVLDLWNNEYPEKLVHESLAAFNSYLHHLSNPNHYLLVNRENSIWGWALTFEREKEKWFAIIVSEKLKGKGYGRKMLDALKKEETVLHGWVIDHHNDLKKNGAPYLSPLEFYKKCDFKVLDNERLELDIISAVKIKWTK